MGYNLVINGVYWGYNLLTNHLLSSWDIQVVGGFSPTPLKDMLVKMGLSCPRFGVKIERYLKPPPSY